MKASHKLLIATGIIALPLCIFFLPLYFASGQAAAGFAKGKSALSSGDFTSGIPHIRYALEQIRSARGAIDPSTASTARSIALDASLRFPSQSPELLKILHDYSIPLTCSAKHEIFTELINAATALSASEKTIPAMGKPLYAAMLWSQDCEPSGAPATAYNKLLETYLHGMGKKYTDDSPFVKERWGAGYISEGHRTPIVPDGKLNKPAAPAEMLKQLTTIAQLSISRILSATAPSAPASTTPPPPQPAPAVTITTPPPPATATQPAPATTTASAPAEQKQEPEKTEPEKPKKEKPAPQQEVVTKKQLENKNKPEPKKETPKKEPPDPNAPVEREILRQLSSRGIDVKQVNISKNGKAVEVTIMSTASGERQAKEHRALYTTIYQKTVAEAETVKASKIIINCNGKDGYPRYQLNTKVSDYEKFLDNKITGKQLLSIGRVVYGF